MKPAWDALMEEYKDHPTTLIADIDCTADGESLCQDIGVEGYPTIKWGDPADLQDYEGGRDKDALLAFAKDLKPMCSPKNVDLCDDEKKQQIEKLMKMSASDREELITTEQAKIDKLESDFKTMLEGLQKTYEEEEKKKTEGIKAVKDAGLGLMKAVHAAAQKGSEEL